MWAASKSKGWPTTHTQQRKRDLSSMRATVLRMCGDEFGQHPDELGGTFNPRSSAREHSPSNTLISVLWESLQKVHLNHTALILLIYR